MSVGHGLASLELLEAVDVELADEAVEAVVAEELGQNFLFHALEVDDFYRLPGLVPSDYRLELSFLTRKILTLSRASSLLMNLPIFDTPDI